LGLLHGGGIEIVTEKVSEQLPMWRFSKMRLDTWLKVRLGQLAAVNSIGLGGCQSFLM
jgi:hypothetical protein